MGFGSKVRDASEPVLVEQASHQCGVADVALDELNAAIGDKELEALEIGRIGHVVDHDQPVAGPRGSPCMHQILADEACATGDENAVH